MIFIIKPCIIIINLFHFNFCLHDCMSLNQNDDWCPGFLDTEIAPAIKPTPQNKGQNVDTKSRLNGCDLWYDRIYFETYLSPFTLRRISHHLLWDVSLTICFETSLTIYSETYLSPFIWDVSLTIYFETSLNISFETYLSPFTLRHISHHLIHFTT